MNIAKISIAAPTTIALSHNGPMGVAYVTFAVMRLRNLICIEGFRAQLPKVRRDSEKTPRVERVTFHQTLLLRTDGTGSVTSRTNVSQGLVSSTWTRISGKHYGSAKLGERSRESHAHGGDGL